MLKLARIASLITFALIATLAWAQCIFLEESLPLGGTTAVQLDVSKSSSTKQEIIDGLRQWGERYNLEITKSVPVSSGTDLVALGARPPEKPTPVRFMNPLRQAMLVPASALGDASLQGSLSVTHPTPEALSYLGKWAQERQIMLDVQQPSELTKIASVTTMTGGWLALLAAGTLMAAIAIGWFATHARSREIRMLNGSAPWRIWFNDIGPIATALIMPLVGLSALLTAIVMLWRGPENGGPFGEIITWYAAGISLAIILCSVLLSISTLPRIRDLAARRPALIRFDGIATLIKAVSVGLILAALPGLISTCATAFQDAQARARWSAVANGVAIRITADSPENFAKVESKLVHLTAVMTSHDTAAMCYDVGFPQADLERFDSLIIVDQAYLKAMHVDVDHDLMPVPPASMSPQLRATMDAQLELWLTDAARDVKNRHLMTATPGTAFPALGDPRHPYALHQSPLLLVIDSSTELAPNVISAATTNQALFFTDTELLHRAIHDLGLGTSVLSIDRIADLAITSAALTQLTAVLGVIALFLIVGAVVLTAQLSARISALCDVKRIVPLHLAGQPWSHILRRRLLLECILIAAITAVVGIGLFLSNRTHAQVWGQTLGVSASLGVAYIAYWWIVSIHANEAVFHNTLSRKE